jgi:hypothetical protein
VANPSTTSEQIASAIIHETTHARIERHGISYKEELRSRIEAVCVRRELAFAARLPDSGLSQELARKLDWCQANPDYFNNSNLQTNIKEAIVEDMRDFGVSDRIIQASLFLRSIPRRVRAFSPLLSWVIAVPLGILLVALVALSALMGSMFSSRNRRPDSA